MLGILQMDVKSCIYVYTKIAPEIFPRQNILKAGAKIFWHQPLFDAKLLESLVKEIMRIFPQKRDENIKLRQEDDPTMRDNCKIWEACRATSAVPIFFPPAQISSPPHRYIDGGFVNNNPIIAAYEEAAAMSRGIGCIVSLGTGVSTPSYGLLYYQLVKYLAEVSTSTEVMANIFRTMVKGSKIMDRYYRFNVPQGLENISLHEWQKENEITTATDEYINDNKTLQELQGCASLLRQLKENEASTNVDADISIQCLEGLVKDAHKIFSKMKAIGDVISQGTVQKLGRYLDLPPNLRNEWLHKDIDLCENLYKPAASEQENVVNYLKGQLGGDHPFAVAAVEDYVSLCHLAGQLESTSATQRDLVSQLLEKGAPNEKIVPLKRRLAGFEFQNHFKYYRGLSQQDSNVWDSSFESLAHFKWLHEPNYDHATYVKDIGGETTPALVSGAVTISDLAANFGDNYVNQLLSQRYTTDDYRKAFHNLDELKGRIYSLKND
ncbi:acyl transferase/acyl hydrolase/lysophospholipase [Aspergillus transmontanensis]|uniref:Acyl transferase/acyl hydrolase/lysophospholipase n=1 Tax=Aspergillus transmontanensis TaxID=1034304 RepID=A0A5N6VPE8_9EURO|nr:acyl transferase/acyl hydrolase/lysophospholipase [Aspergillus transmontanensis]